VLGIRVTDDMDQASRLLGSTCPTSPQVDPAGQAQAGTAVEIKLGYQGQLKSVCKGEISNIEMVLTPDARPA